MGEVCNDALSVEWKTSYLQILDPASVLEIKRQDWLGETGLGGLSGRLCYFCALQRQSKEFISQSYQPLSHLPPPPSKQAHKYTQTTKSQCHLSPVKSSSLTFLAQHRSHHSLLSRSSKHRHPLRIQPFFAAHHFLGGGLGLGGTLSLIHI